MKLKKGVDPFGIRPELLLALFVADSVWNDRGFEATVTSLNDSRHSKTSLHYVGCGADLRTRMFESKKIVGEVAAELREALGDNPDYDVIVESDHIHIEYQRKRKD